MRAPAFWWRPWPSPAGRLLQPLGALFGALSARRMDRPGARAKVPVLCVGNLVVGGAGKTPTALTLAALLRSAGETPWLLSRGHGGREAGPLIVDSDRHGAAEVGDEPLLLARRHPTVVARDRARGAALAAANGASVIVMDDGLQNPGLVKDVSFAVIDMAVGLGNGLCLPAGPLRAPLAAQWPRVDAVVAVGEGAAGGAVVAEARARGLPVLAARLVADEAVSARLAGQRVLAVCGIGRPGKFLGTLDEIGAAVAGQRLFPDHHAYSARDVSDIVAEAARLGAIVATTEKDATKLAGPWPAQAPALITVPVALVFDDPAALMRFVGARLAATRTQARP